MFFLQIWYIFHPKSVKNIKKCLNISESRDYTDMCGIIYVTKRFYFYFPIIFHDKRQECLDSYVHFNGFSMYCGDNNPIDSIQYLLSNAQAYDNHALSVDISEKDSLMKISIIS